jgi:cobalt-zinc-cadmium efflux system membrane fusion protein
MSILDYHLERKHFVLIGCALVFVLSIGWGVRLHGSSGQAAAQDSLDSTPAFVHSGDQIIIPENSALRSRLQVQSVSVRSTPQTLQLPAIVEADPAHTVNILPPLSGRIVKLDVRLGDRVAKDQPLAVIDSADLAQAYADDDKARTALEHGKCCLERARGVHQAGGGSLKDLEQAQSDYAQGQAEFNRTQARLREIGAQAKPQGKSRLLTIVSPVSGTVTALTTASGAFANDPNASLMTVSNLESVWVTAMVPENDIALIAGGQNVDVSFSAYPGQVFHGTVAFVSDIVEPDTRRTRVRIAFANQDGKLKPNMFATASFKIPQKSAVFVPNSALLMDNDSTSLLVETAPWTFARRRVLPAYAEGESTRIDQGLTPEERVIVKGGVLLHD